MSSRQRQALRAFAAWFRYVFDCDWWFVRENIHHCTLQDVRSAYVAGFIAGLRRARSRKRKLKDKS